MDSANIFRFIMLWAAEESSREAVRHHRIDVMRRAEARVAQGSTCRGGGAWVFDNSTLMFFLYFYFSLDQLNFRLRRFNFRLRRAYSAFASASRSPRASSPSQPVVTTETRNQPRLDGGTGASNATLRFAFAAEGAPSCAALRQHLLFPYAFPREVIRARISTAFHLSHVITILPRYRVSTIEHSALIERAAPFGSTVAARKV